MIKTLYIKSPNPRWLDIAGYLQETYSFEPVLWISGTTTYHEDCKRKFPNAEIFSHYKSLRNLVPDYVRPGAHCVDAEFLKINAHHEDIFYNMIDRWHGNPETISMEKRRHYYIDMANAWFAIYESLNIDAVIISTIPHRLYDYIAYIVAQYLNIPFIMLEQSNELIIDEKGNRKTLYYFVNHLEDRTKDIAAASQEKRTPSPDLQRCLDAMLGDYESLRPAYYKKKEQKPGFVDRLKHAFRIYVPLVLRLFVHVPKYFIQNKSIYNTKLHFSYRNNENQSAVRFQNMIAGLFCHDKIKRRAKRAKAWYDQHAVAPDLTQNYVYFASHFQPERSSTPDTGLCQWEELMIETIAASIPADWKIYYKEHPSNFREPVMPDNNRSEGLYQRLQYLAPNLEFVPIDHDPFALIDSARCVASGRGTSCWQAITRGVPAMIFGEVWYAGCSEVVRITAKKTCKDFIKKIESGYKPSQDNIVQYLCALEDLGGCYGWARGKEPYNDNLGDTQHKASIQDFGDDLYKAYQNQG